MTFLLIFLLAPVPGEPPSLASLSWMAGSWTSESGLVEEHWTTPAGGMLLGMNRAQRPGKKAFFEYLRIEAREDGVYYAASPKGSTPVFFKLTSVDGQKAVFENPDHDFPQKIVYERKGDQLCAVISGGAGEKARETGWCFKKE